MKACGYYVVKLGTPLDEKIGIFSEPEPAIDLAEKMKAETGDQYEIYAVSITYSTQTLKDFSERYRFV